MSVEGNLRSHWTGLEMRDYWLEVLTPGSESGCTYLTPEFILQAIDLRGFLGLTEAQEAELIERAQAMRAARPREEP